MTEKACERCEWVKAKPGYGNDGEGRRVSVIYFTCRFQPPLPISGWPAVKRDDWCGQFKERGSLIRNDDQ